MCVSDALAARPVLAHTHTRAHGAQGPLWEGGIGGLQNVRNAEKRSENVLKTGKTKNAQ